MCFALESQIKAFTKRYADIVFLLDSSNSMGSANFEKVKKVIVQIVEQLDIGSKKYQIGLAQYSEGGKVEFLLNRYKTKKDILNHIQQSTVFMGGPLKTGSALQFLREVYFVEKAGSRLRQGTPQFTVIFSSAKSEDDVKKPAKELKEMGVNIATVDVLHSDKKEMKMIATSPLVYQIDDIEDLVRVQKIIDIVEAPVQQEYEAVLDASVPAVCSTASVADIVFLVDESTRIGQKNFQLIRTFLLKIINALEIASDDVRSLKEGCEETEEADIYFLIDSSGSIQTEEFHDMKVFMNEVISMFQIGPNQVRFGVVQYASAPSEEFLINQYNTLTQLKEAIKAIWQIGGGTKTGYALQYMKNLFKTSARDNVPQFLIVITDGESQDQVTMPAEMLRNAGIVIYAIGVKDAAKRELEDIAGTKDRMFFVNDFDSLKLIKHDIAQDICSPEACKNLKADIILLIDTSESMDQFEFEQIKDFIDLIVNKSDIGTDKIQIGLLQFGFNPEEVFPLNKYNNKADLRKAITTMRQVQEGARIGRALDFASPYFDTSEGGRLGVKQYLIVVTDEESSDDVRRAARALRKKGITKIIVLITDEPTTPTDKPNLSAAVQALKQEGIQVFAVGIEDANRTELAEIAGEKGKWFFSPSYNALDSLYENITYLICDESKPACGTGEADLVFLIDGSDSISKQNFSTMKTFMKEVVDSFIIAKDKVRIGVAQYSTDPQKEFYLNEFFNNNAIKKKIDAIAQLKGHTFTGAGLKFVRSFFESANGGRQYNGVVQYLIVITDGRSDDKVEDAAIVLRKDGVQIFVIGIGTSISFELQKISGFPSRVYVLEDFEQLQSDTRKIVKEICNPGDKPTPDCEIDISIGVDISEPSFWDRLITVDSANVKALLIFSDGPDDRIDVLKTTVDDLRGQGLLNFFCVTPVSSTFQGVRGYSGKKGEAGNSGIDGIYGQEGEQGVPGSHGQKGHSGRRGREGPRGEPGEPGQPGARGDNGFLGSDNNELGPPGKKGNMGQQGEPGDDGEPGEAGESGANGLVGQRGPPGLMGELGNEGNQGYPGEAGLRGQTGVLGLRGIPGPLGPHGLPGHQGNAGIKGESGAIGKGGHVGPKGEQGDPGEKGQMGLPGTRGFPGIDGSNGYGLIGRKGTKGLTGYPGNSGRQGEIGDPGNPGNKGAKGIKEQRARDGTPGKKGNPGSQGPPGRMGSKGPKGTIAMTRKDLLMEAVQGIPLERSSGQRNIGRAMRFVARNAFKRHRQGALIKKVAVFLTAGPSQDAASINTAVLEFSALDIIPTVIALRETSNVREAFLTDNTGRFKLFVWESKEEERLNYVSLCSLCYDTCNPVSQCEIMDPPPININMDIAYIMDGSRDVSSEEFETMKEFMSNMLDYFAIASLPLDEADDSEMTQLSSVPVEQHLLHMGRADKLELPYVLRFSKAFLNLLKRELNIYPPIILQEKCDNLHRGDTYLQAVGITDRILFSDSKHNDLFQPSELSRKNVQNKMLKTTQGPREEQYGQIENKYFTSISIQNGDGTETEELFEKLQRAKDACSKDTDIGECENYTLKWYYHKQRNMCFQFWYGGCGGNKNRFETQEECDALCVVSP
ncbi:collagen alpha-6VI chain-like [Crotalus adamanteus]|uniref:Collagen alpha-6VI chain-like n=1 Tax=Crotalus adamanteus TaxID=8729 RepID=A0AAW1B366_CROAD